MDALDYYLLDQHLEYYFADEEDLRDGIEDDDCALGLYIGDDD